MKKFLAIYMMPIAAMDEMMKNSTPEQRKEGMDKWIAWGKAHEKDLAELGAPVGKNKRLTLAGTTDERNEIGGYSIVQAESIDDVSKVLADNPHLQMPGAYVEIMECLPM